MGQLIFSVVHARVGRGRLRGAAGRERGLLCRHQRHHHTQSDQGYAKQ